MAEEDRSEIAFFDLETTVPSRGGQGCAILEFGGILVCPRKLVELRSYSTLVRPSDLSLISSLSRDNGITKDAVVSAPSFADIADAVVSAPSFADIADAVYNFLHGRIWAGHNILSFDCVRIRKAFAEINRPPPRPKGTIDTLQLLRDEFGRRAGDMKMATLATYFRLGQQTHRSLDDVRMNLAVLKHCAAVLFLESITTPQSNDCDEFLEPDNISASSISVIQKIQILHHNSPLQLQCPSLKVRFGITTKFVDHAGRPKLSFVVDAPSYLFEILDEIDDLAQKLSIDSGSSSEWRPVVTRKPGFFNSPTIRLNLPTIADGETSRWATEIYVKDGSVAQKLVFTRFDVTELDPLFTPGRIIDAFISLDAYDYRQNAGIRLVARKLIVHSS